MLVLPLIRKLCGVADAYKQRANLPQGSLGSLPVWPWPDSSSFDNKKQENIVDVMEEDIMQLVQFCAILRNLVQDGYEVMTY